MKKRKPLLTIAGILLPLFVAVVVSTMVAEIATAESATVMRTLPAELVSAGEFFTVRIEARSYGTFGHVIEKLPEGCCYLTSRLDPGSVNVNESTNTVKFILVDEASFTYTVIAPDEVGTYTFRGELIDDDGVYYDIDGDTEIKVEEAEEGWEPTATRTLPEEPIAAGESFTIEIEASHYGIHGHIVETLPEGFVFEDSTLNPEVEDNTVDFELSGEPSFTYSVTAPDEEDTYTFEGILIDEEKDEYDISGDTEIVVGEEGGEVTLPTNITAGKPIDAVVNSALGELRTFNISINQPADISWQINGTEVQTNESVTDAVYTNTSAVIGTWNVSAIATNAATGLSAMHTWIWHVRSTSAVNATPTSTSAVTPTPLVTPTPKSKLSPRPTSIASPTQTQSAKPAVPGFESVFALAAIFAVAYLLLFRKKGDVGR